MKRYKGKVKNNVIVLEGNAQLPEGAEVEVRLATKQDKQERLKEAIRRVLANQITRPVGMAEIIEEDKQERDDR
jgi:hypothetical protein